MLELIALYVFVSIVGFMIPEILTAISGGKCRFPIATNILCTIGAMCAAYAFS